MSNNREIKSAGQNSREISIDDVILQAASRAHFEEATTSFCGNHANNKTTAGENIIPSPKIFVKTCIVFLKIGEIDTVKEQFAADVFMQCKWREPSLDYKTPDELKSVDFKLLWNPLLFFENEIAEKKVVPTYKALRNERGEVFVSEWRKIRGDFWETLELENFPLDVQDLSITIVSERPDSLVELVLDEDNPPRVNVETFADAQEWHLYQHIDINRKTQVEFHNEKHNHSAIKFTCQAARRPGFFYYNIFLVMFFITCLAFGTFAIECYLPQNRLQLGFTLVLTAIAFKIAVGAYLPKVSYLTYADSYVLLSIFFLVITCAWHATVAVVPELCYDVTKKPSFFYQWKSEQWVVLGFFGIYFIGHVAFFTTLYIKAWRKRIQVIKKERDYRSKRK